MNTPFKDYCFRRHPLVGMHMFKLSHTQDLPSNIEVYQVPTQAQSSLPEQHAIITATTKKATRKVKSTIKRVPKVPDTSSQTL